MHLNTFNEFRLGLYAAFGREQDALFELCDALLTEPTAHSLPELSFSPFYQRQFPALYKSLQRGRIDRDELRHLFGAFVPQASTLLNGSARLMVGLDASNIARPLSPTARDRTCLHLPNLPETNTGTAITYGWQFSTLVLLPDQSSSATYILENTRIESAKTAAQTGAEQRLEWAALLPPDTVMGADRYYGSAKFVGLTQSVGWTKLLRIKRNLVFYRAVPPLPEGVKAGRGAPRKDGAAFRLKEPTTYGVPDEEWQGVDEQGQPLKVTRWNGLHFKRVRSCQLSVVRVERPQATDKKRDPRISWFVLIEAAHPEFPLELAEIPALYRRRYSIEHGFRFDKQSLMWETPHLRTPEQFELWTQLLSAVHNETVLAQPLVEIQWRGWESKNRRPSLGQVRHSVAGIIKQLGSPAKAPQLRGKAPGRAIGTKVKPAERYEVVRKRQKRAKKRRKAA